MVEPKDLGEILQKLVTVCQDIKDVFVNAARDFVRFCNRFMGVFRRLPGYKRLAKAKQLAYFESISSGKSNNWRKVHGLHLARSRC